MKRQRMAHLTLAALTLGLAAGGGLLLSAQSDDDPPASEPAALQRVRVAAVEAAEGTREVRLSGVTRASRRAQLAFLTGGRLAERPVEIGDRVRAGQRLARLDDLESRNARDSARAALGELTARRAQSGRELERVRRLAEAKAATAEELEEADTAAEALRAAEDAARARLREAERLLDETVLEAPFDATVTEVLLEPGEHASSGRPVVAVSGTEGVEVEVEVPESLILELEEGREVTVELSALGGERVAGRITSAGRTSPGPGRLFPVIVTLDSGRRLLPGLTAELVLELGTAELSSLPVEAVINPGGRRPAVLVVKDGAVQRVEVEVGSLLGAEVTVEGDLAPGDLVVVAGHRGLLEGEQVVVERGDVERGEVER